MKFTFRAICLWLCFASTAFGLVHCSIEDRIISLIPGEKGQIEIPLYNPDPQPAAVRVYLEDWERAEDGTQLFYPAGTLPNSAAGQLKLAESTIVLEPKQSGKLILEVQVPHDQRGSRTAMLFVEGGSLPAPPQAEGDKMNISIRALLRYGIKIYVVARGTEEPGTKITGCSLENPRDGKIPVSIQLENCGNVHLSYKGRLEVRTLDGEVLEKVSLQPFSILPKAKRSISGQVSVPAAGKYLLLAVLDYGGQTLLAAEAPFEIRGEASGK